MKEILSNEFASVSYDSESSSIITVWKKPSTSEAYKVIFSVILEKILEYNAEAFISDIFQQGIVSTENRFWLQNEILPKAYAGGLRKVGTITPNDVFSKFYVESIKNGVFINSLDLEFRYFQDLTSAQIWAMQEELPA
ncbi:MAG: hypothetical protein KAI29_11010 [Cyclobacteriaceae bacterium]|nr:hypothetical protein [Cyclobacteriaceae bacterium]